jgi:hypothetical protein
VQKNLYLTLYFWLWKKNCNLILERRIAGKKIALPADVDSKCTKADYLGV